MSGTTPPTPPIPEVAWRDQLLVAYKRSRVAEQIAYYEARSAQYERARRAAVTAAAGLLVLAALFGALAAADPHRRSLWAFVAALCSATATAIASYEAAFGFERLSREYRETRGALELAEVSGPSRTEIAAAGGDALMKRHVAEMESLLRGEVDQWSRVTEWPTPGPPPDADE